MVALLLEAGANPLLADKQGFTGNAKTLCIIFLINVDRQAMLITTRTRYTVLSTCQS